MTPPEKKPPRVPPRLRAVPAIRDLFWCHFPEDAHLPEFWKCRPVIVISFRNSLSGAVTVIPCPSQAQPDNKWAFPLTTTIDGAQSWSISNLFAALRVSVSLTGATCQGSPNGLPLVFYDCDLPIRNVADFIVQLFDEVRRRYSQVSQYDHQLDRV